MAVGSTHRLRAETLARHAAERAELEARIRAAAEQVIAHPPRGIRSQDTFCVAVLDAAAARGAPVSLSPDSLRSGYYWRHIKGDYARLREARRAIAATREAAPTNRRKDRGERLKSLTFDVLLTGLMEASRSQGMVDRGQWYNATATRLEIERSDIDRAIAHVRAMDPKPPRYDLFSALLVRYPGARTTDESGRLIALRRRLHGIVGRRLTGEVSFSSLTDEVRGGEAELTFLIAIAEEGYVPHARRRCFDEATGDYHVIYALRALRKKKAPPMTALYVGDEIDFVTIKRTDRRATLIRQLELEGRYPEVDCIVFHEQGWAGRYASAALALRKMKKAPMSKGGLELAGLRAQIEVRVAPLRVSASPSHVKLCSDLRVLLQEEHLAKRDERLLPRTLERARDLLARVQVAAPETKSGGGGSSSLRTSLMGRPLVTSFLPPSFSSTLFMGTVPLFSANLCAGIL